MGQEAPLHIPLPPMNASYERRRDLIHITTDDPSLSSEGFHLTLKPGTQSELLVRDLLEEAGAIQKLDRSSVEAIWKPGNTLAVLGDAGIGKTTFLVTLATMLVAEGKSVLIAESDITTFVLRGFAPSPVVDVEADDVENYIANNLFTTTFGWDGMHTPIVGHYPHRQISPHFFGALQKLQRRYDVVLVDTPGGDFTYNFAELSPLLDNMLFLLSGTDGFFEVEEWLSRVEKNIKRGEQGVMALWARLKGDPPLTERQEEYYHIKGHWREDRSLRQGPLVGKDPELIEDMSRNIIPLLPDALQDNNLLRRAKIKSQATVQPQVKKEKTTGSGWAFLVAYVEKTLAEKPLAREELVTAMGILGAGPNLSKRVITHLMEAARITLDEDGSLQKS